jgi:hypothetical protein
VIVDHVLDAPADRRAQLLLRHVRRIEHQELIVAGKEHRRALASVESQRLRGLREVLGIFDELGGETQNRRVARAVVIAVHATNVALGDREGHPSGVAMSLLGPPHGPLPVFF